MKHPIVVAILNAFLPGLGYVIIKERLVFGWMMLVGSLFVTLAILLDAGNVTRTLMTESLPSQVLETLAYGLITAAFAYDAYALAKGQRKSTPVAENPQE